MSFIISINEKEEKLFNEMYGRLNLLEGFNPDDRKIMDTLMEKVERSKFMSNAIRTKRMNHNKLNESNKPRTKDGSIIKE